jgi:2-C-methyl-D-erythritol 4-phosphate cytidylyltransferase
MSSGASLVLFYEVKYGGDSASRTLIKSPFWGRLAQVQSPEYGGQTTCSGPLVGWVRAILYTPLVMRVFVILPAAGIGTRMAAGGASTAAPKQFLEIGGVPVLVRSVRAFLAVPRVDAVCVAVRAQERERVEAQMLEYGLGARVHMVEGGDNRQQSVGNALAALECDEADVVLVHDAVRPLIDPATIERTIDAVVKHGAAIVGLPAVDTIKQVERTADGAIVTATIPRERIVQAQTPQGALFGLLRRAFIEAETDGFSGTDEASLLERAGVEVAVVSGSARNFKITQPGDIELAEFYLGKATADVRG